MSSAPIKFLDSCCDLITDGTHHSPETFPEGDFLYITSKNVRPATLELENVSYVPRSVHDEIYRRCPVRFGDVLYVKDGVNAGTAALNSLTKPFSLLSSVAVIRPKPGVLDSKYLTQWLNCELTQDRLLRGMSGSAIRRLVLAQIRKFEIPVPPLPEQRRIADILDKADAIRRKRKEAIALTEELLRSAFLDMFGDPVTNPKGWEVKPLGDFGDITDGTHKTPTYVQSGIPFLSAKNVRAHNIDWDRIKYIPEIEHRDLIRRCKPEKGDVLLTKSGTIGESAVVDRDIEFSLFESVALIKVDQAILDPLLLSSALNHPSVRKLYGADVKGVGVKHLHLIDIRRLPVLVPPKPLQTRYAAFASRARRRLSITEDAESLIGCLFDTLVHRAFSRRP